MRDLKHAGGVDVVVDDPDVYVDVFRAPAAIADVVPALTKPTVAVSAIRHKTTADVVTDLRQGPQGDPGPRGSLWWAGDGPPTVIYNAQQGDMYLDNLTGDTYWLAVSTGTPPVGNGYGESAYGTGPYGGM